VTRWTRRRFLGTTAAAVCVGCTEPGSDDAVTAGTAWSADSGAGPPTSLPERPPGFGAEVRVGPWADVLEQLDAEGAVYVPEARAWLSRYPADRLPDALGAYDVDLHPGLEAGLVALHQKCPHLGCRVPYCRSSGWFECPCHGSRYTAVGEHREGPGPRGMDAFAIVIDGGDVLIDTGRVVRGLPLGAAIVDQAPSGPHCVSLSES
jgi:cytochrome b6-f complex iron-sulfur subunit